MRRAIVILAVLLTACGGAAAATLDGSGDDSYGVVEICHREGGSQGDSFRVITISENAVDAHLSHGDIYPVPPEGCGKDGHHTTTTKPGHETTTTYKPHETTTTVKETTTTSHGGGGTTTTVKTTTTTTGGGGTTTTVHTTTTTTGGGGTTTTSSSTTTSTSSPGRTTTTTSTSSPPPPPGIPTTTTTPGVFVRAAGTTCDREVPKIIIDFGTLTELNGRVGTLTMADLNGNVLSVQPLTYQSGTTVELLYPGTAVNPDGSIADVPGWILQPDGFWVEDPSDAFLRDGIVLTYTVNPTATAVVSYPPASAGCNTPTRPPGSPPPRVPGQPTPPVTTVPGLPPTL
jgi:hypothetical protein